MFTDWTETDPHYFFAIGALYGFIFATLLWLVVVPWVRKKLQDRRFDRESALRGEGRRAHDDIAKHGVFEGSGTLGVLLSMCDKHNPYKPGSHKANLWKAGFLVQLED